MPAKGRKGPRGPAPKARPQARKRQVPKPKPRAMGRPARAIGGGATATSLRNAHQVIPRALHDWARAGNLPVQACVQSVLISVRSQFTVVTSTTNDVNLLFFPGANDTIGWYCNGAGSALADNTVTGAGFAVLKNSMLNSLVSGSPKQAPEWRPTRLWVRLHNSTIFTSRVGGVLVTRPKGNWSTFSPGVVGGASPVNASNLSALPETRFFDFAQMAGPTEFAISAFPTDVEAFSYINTTASDSIGTSTNWLADVLTNGQKWTPLNFFIPASSSQQTLQFEVFACYDCKMIEALASTSPLATLASPPPIGPPHEVVRTAAQALDAGSDNLLGAIGGGLAALGGMAATGMRYARAGAGAAQAAEARGMGYLLMA